MANTNYPGMGRETLGTRAYSQERNRNEWGAFEGVSPRQAPASSYHAGTEIARLEPLGYIIRN
jgi:hypothetical protein